MRVRNGSMLVPGRMVNPENGKSVDLTFRIDTGSDFTAVCLYLASKIDAKPIDFTSVQGVDRDPITAPVFRVDLSLQECSVGKIDVIGLDFTGLNYAGLIGNDVLDMGLLVRDGETGHWYFAIGSGTCGCAYQPQPSVAPLFLAGAAGFFLGAAGTLLLTRK